MTIAARISYIALALMFVLLPLSAQAATPTIAELQAKVIGLQAELAALKAARGMDANFSFTVPTAAFDQRSYTSVSHYPSLTGTANVKSVFVLLRDAKGAGISGTVVPVEKGVWSYSSVAYLPNGAYTVELSGGAQVQTRTLVVDVK
jgi:hypothetical protein